MMNTRNLTSREKANYEVVKATGLPAALLFVTATGLQKSIMDATLPIRTLLAEAGVHDYGSQGQGPSNKRVVAGKILADDRIENVDVSLYRPITKNGDPRLWPRNFSHHADPDDACAVFIARGCICILDLTRSSIAEDEHAGSSTAPLKFLALNRKKKSPAANELLNHIRALADKGPLKAVGYGDTSIGRTIETALGIRINSSQQPDYKGIELKSKRWIAGHQSTRYTLFACVPDWLLSPCKSSAEILAEYGYPSGSVFKLYCTVSATKRNSQGLQFRIDSNIGRLVEYAWRRSPTKQDVAVWELGRLHRYFGAKHRETFWIHASPVSMGGMRAFKLNEIIHTRGPSYPQFDQFLEDGVITMDHLIKRTGTRVVEKGPLFKVMPNRLVELFLGVPEIYRLG